MSIENITHDYNMWMKLREMNGHCENLTTAIYELATEHGREFQSIPWRSWRGRGYRRMQEGACFGNATVMAQERDELTYVEGLAWCGFLVVHHGWCVTPDGLVVDPTWRELGTRSDVREWEYFGIPFTDDFVLAESARNKYWGTFLELRKFHEDFPIGAVADLTNRPKADSLEV